MSVAINLPPDVENIVRRQAARHGQDVAAFVLEAVQEKVAKAPTAEAGSAARSESGTDAGIEKRFLALVAMWKYDVGPVSSVTQMVAHPAYLQIIGLGRAVLPYLFRELARQPDHWFAALSAITGEDPIPTGTEGNVAAMSEAWLAWGRTHGFL